MTGRALAAALGALLVGLSGCGGGEKARPRGSCPGALRCPYSAATVLGSRGEGVLRSPEAVAIGAQGDVYVGDQYSHVIQRFSHDGRFEGEWGSFGSGPGQFGAVGGLALDSRGFVYVVDSSHDRVEKFDANGRFVLAWGHRGAGVGEFYFGAGGGPDRPPGGGIAVRGNHVYVSDTRNNRIERFRLDGSGGRVLQANRPLRLSDPRGLTTTAAGLYVADNQNRRIRVLKPTGSLLHAAGSFGSGPGQFGNPFGVAVNRFGEVFVADDNNNRVVKLDRRLSYVGAWSSMADGAPLSYLRALTTDAAGNVFVAATARNLIVEFDRNGRQIREWGASGKAPGQFVEPIDVAAGLDGGLLVAVQFASLSHLDAFDAQLHFRARLAGARAIIGHHFFIPSAAATASDGTVWVSDRDNNMLRHLDQHDALIGVLGASGPAAARLLAPWGVAIDRGGAIYVVDRGHDRIVKYSSNGRLIRSWGSRGAGRGQFLRPSSVAVAATGAVYVADTGNSRIEEFSRSGRYLAGWGGRGARKGQFRNPHGIGVDGAGHVFVADGGNNRIEEFTAKGRFLAAWGAYGIGAGQLISPGGLTVTCAGAVAVADTYNNRVQVFAHAATPVACRSSRRPGT